MLAKVRQGVEIIIEQNHRAVAVIKKPPTPEGRMISEVMADLKARRSNAVMDDDFAGAIEEGMKVSRQPWNPPPGISPRDGNPDRRLSAGS